MQNSLFALGIIEKYTNVSPSLVESPSLVFLQSQPAEEEQGVFANVLMEFSVLLQQLSTDRENVWIGNPRIFLENIFQNLSYYQSFLNKNTFFSSATQQNNTTVVNKQIYAIQRQISTMRQILYENAHHTTAVSQQTTAATIQHILQQYLQLSSPTLPNDQIRSRSPQINIKNTVFKTDQNNYTANRFYTQQQKNSYKTNALSVQQLSTQQTLRIGPPVVSSVQHLSWNKESKRSVFSRFDAKIYHHQNAFIALHDTKKDEAFFLSAQKYDIYRVQKNIELIRRVFGWETNFFQQFMPNLVENTAQQNHVTQNLAVWYHQIQQHNAQRLYKSNAFFEAYNQNILQHYASKLSQSGDTVEILNNSVFTKLLHLHNSENGRNLPFESFIYPSLVQKVGGFVKEQQVIHKTDPAISNDAKPNYILKYDTEPPQKQGAVYQIRSQNPVSTISNLFTTTFSAVPNQQKDILPLMQYVRSERTEKETAVSAVPTLSLRSGENRILPVVADQARGKAETVWNRYSMQQQAWNVFASRNDWSTQNVFYPMTVQQMQAVQQGLPNPFYKREWLLPVSYRESFVRNRELLQRVTEKTNSEAYHISLQQNLVQENRRETIVVSEKSGTTNVIPKAAQNAVMAETVSAEKPAKETAVPTAPTTSFRSRESGNFPVVADQARGKAETVLNRYSMQQQAWNVFASRNEWSTQNVFYPMTVRQMQAVQQGLPNPFHRKESLLPVSHRERFVRERELLQRVTEKTNNAVYHFTIGHIQHQVTPSTSQNFVKRDRDSSKDNQKWSVSNKQPAINNGQNIFYDEKSFVMVPYLQITPLLGQFPTLTTRHTETHTLFKNSIATTHKISEQAKQSFSLKNFVGKSVQSSAQQRQPKTAALPQRSVLNAQKIDVPTVIFQKQAEKMHGTLSPSRASERSNEKSVPLPSVQPSRFTYPQTAAAQTAHRTTTFTPKHSTLPLAERKQPSANLPTSKLNPQKQNTEKNVTLLKKTLETQQQWSKFLVELEKSGASLVGNGVKELFSRNEFHRINQVMQQNVLVKMQNTTAYRNLLPSTNKITTIHHHLSVRSTAVEAAGVQASTLRNRSGSSPFSYPDRGELSYRRTTQKQDAPPQQPTIEAQNQLRTIKKEQTEQTQELEQQTGALKKLEKQLKQQEEQITQLMRRNSVSEPKIPSSHQLADQIMKEIQRQMRLERQRRGG